MRSPRTQKADFSCVIDRYPEHAVLIRRLLLSDLSFRELCQDYQLLRDIITDFHASATSGMPDVPQEYATLRMELELDIVRSLQRSSETQSK